MAGTPKAPRAGRLGVTGGLAVLALALFGGWTAAADVARPTTTAGASELTLGVRELEAPSQAQAEPLICVLNALGTPPIAHGVVEYFPAAIAATIAETEAGAVETARALASKFGSPPAPASARAIARQMSYAEFIAAARWPTNPTINPQRCVWVVTVHAPMAVKVAPGRPPRTVNVYTVALDAGSGTLVGLLAGRDLIR